MSEGLPHRWAMCPIRREGDCPGSYHSLLAAVSGIVREWACLVVSWCRHHQNTLGSTRSPKETHTHWYKLHQWPYVQLWLSSSHAPAVSWRLHETLGLGCSSMVEHAWYLYSILNNAKGKEKGGRGEGRKEKEESCVDISGNCTIKNRADKNSMALSWSAHKHHALSR